METQSFETAQLFLSWALRHEDWSSERLAEAIADFGQIQTLFSILEFGSELLGSSTFDVFRQKLPSFLDQSVDPPFLEALHALLDFTAEGV